VGFVSTWRELEVDGMTRRYLEFAPASPPGTPMPVVVDLHGSGSEPAEHARITRSFDLVRHGALVVLPAAAVRFRLLPGQPEGFAWTVPGAPLPGETEVRVGPDDSSFIVTLMSMLRRRPDVDGDRLHVMGYSGGARLICHIAATRPETASSVVAVAGVRAPTGDANLPVRLLAVHATHDEINTYRGGLGPRWDEPVAEAVRHWAEAAGCSTHPESRALGEGAIEWRYRRADGDSPVRLIALADGGHAWPGSSDADHLAALGSAATFDATGAAWEFFAATSGTQAG
jgi:polyhydroxybutyrate depolymerase